MTIPSAGVMAAEERPLSGLGFRWLDQYIFPHPLSLTSIGWWRLHFEGSGNERLIS